MRLLFLHKFLNKEVLNDDILTGTPLVIDGHHFFYNLYEEAKLNYEFGIEAKEYARIILRKPLNMFRKAGIKCFFVFKGGDTDISDKIPKLFKINFDTESNYKYVPPVFLREVCLQVLEDIGIPYSTCLAETTNDCVALAQMLGCPVLSNSVEYYFRPVRYIPLQTLKYSDPNDYIICKQYELNDFITYFSLTDRKVAIFAALKNIQLFPHNRFDHLLKTWDAYKFDSDLQYISILKWLSEHTADVALNNITEFLSDEDDAKTFCNHVDLILENMNMVHDSVATDYLYNRYKLPISQQDPLWFEKGVAMQKIAIPYINLYKHKFILGSSATENKESPDSIMLSIDIIKYAYNLLTNFQTADIYVYQDSENYVKINTADTIIDKTKYKCNEIVFENGWTDIKYLKLFERFLSKFNINIDRIDLPDDARILFIALAYYALKKFSYEIVVRNHAYCVIVSYVISTHLLLSYDKSNYRRCQRHDISEYDLDEARNVTKKYFICDSNEAKAIFDGNVLKPLVEFQYCLLHMNYLNTLCGNPYMPTQYHLTFNGTFIYKLLRDMADCEPTEFIQDLLKTAPSVLRFINTLIKAYEELIV